MDRMLQLIEGLIVDISRLSFKRSSKLEEQELKMIKSLKEIGWSVFLWWDRTLNKLFLEIGLPVKVETLMCSQTPCVNGEKSHQYTKHHSIDTETGK